MALKEYGEPVVVLDHVSKEYPIQQSASDKPSASTDGQAPPSPRQQGHAGAAGRKTVVALADVHLAEGSPFEPVRRGEFVMLRGPSGGGKTTLLNILGTLDLPTSGDLRLLSSRVTKKSSDSELSELRLRKIGFVFQTFNLLATMSAFENVELPMTILGKLGKAQRRQRAKELLELVGLQDRMGHLPSELSGGEQQRVAIARALSNEPELLLLDEPTGDLDTKNTIEVMDLLLDLNTRLRTTLVMVTHNPDVECYADRVLYLQDGRIVRQARNRVQTRLELRPYLDYLNSLADSQNATAR
eukprot:m51a1_g1496 putative abc transporter domain protein (300) ;mRNA; f:327486-328601